MLHERLFQEKGTSAKFQQGFELTTGKSIEVELYKMIKFKLRDHITLLCDTTELCSSPVHGLKRAIDRSFCYILPKRIIYKIYHVASIFVFNNGRWVIMLVFEAFVVSSWGFGL
jgi:hypothetical protein